MILTPPEMRAAELTVDAPPTMDKSAFLQLLREQRYEDALTVLMKLRGAAPDNGSVSRGIQHLKEKVLDGYLVRLGNLDRAPTRGSPTRPFTAEESVLVRLVDGTSTLADLLESSTLGKLVSARLLTQLLDEGVLVLPHERPRLRLVVEPEPVEPPRAAAVAAPSFDALLEQAGDLCLSRHFDEALAVYERCARLQPDHPRVRHNLERLRKLIQQRS